MSTRAHIAFFAEEPTPETITKPEVLIYKHSDGYPEETLPLVVGFSTAFNKKRGLRDVDYATAQCIAYLIANSDDGMKKWYEEVYKKEYVKDYLGYGLGTTFHGDIEFYYVVTPDEVKVYSVDYNYDEPDEAKRYNPILTLERTLPLNV